MITGGAWRRASQARGRGQPACAEGCPAWAPGVSGRICGGCRGARAAGGTGARRRQRPMAHRWGAGGQGKESSAAPAFPGAHQRCCARPAPPTATSPGVCCLGPTLQGAAQRSSKCGGSCTPCLIILRWPLTSPLPLPPHYRGLPGGAAGAAAACAACGAAIPRQGLPGKRGRHTRGTGYIPPASRGRELVPIPRMYSGYGLRTAVWEVCGRAQVCEEVWFVAAGPSQPTPLSGTAIAARLTACSPLQRVQKVEQRRSQSPSIQLRLPAPLRRAPKAANCCLCPSPLQRVGDLERRRAEVVQTTLHSFVHIYRSQVVPLQEIAGAIALLGGGGGGGPRRVWDGRGGRWRPPHLLQVLSAPNQACRAPLCRPCRRAAAAVGPDRRSLGFGVVHRNRGQQRAEARGLWRGSVGARSSTPWPLYEQCRPHTVRRRHVCAQLCNRPPFVIGSLLYRRLALPGPYPRLQCGRAVFAAAGGGGPAVL